MERSVVSSTFLLKLYTQQENNSKLTGNSVANTTFSKGLFHFERYTPKKANTKLRDGAWHCINNYCKPDIVNIFVQARRASMNHFMYSPEQVQFLYNQLQRAANVSGIKIRKLGMCPEKLRFPITTYDLNVWKQLKGCILAFQILDSFDYPEMNSSIMWKKPNPKS